MINKPRLSASKISTLEKCSYLYWLNYHSDFPKGQNSGSSRGSVTHYVLECLLKDSRREDVAAMIKANDPFSHKGVYRLARFHARKLDVADDVNMGMINEFILTALKSDFFCDGSEELISEYEFNIEGTNYLLKGYIDKIAVYKDKVKIVDYKSSKAKKSKEELAMDYQNLIYTMVVKDKYPDKPIDLTFQFLKFKKEPNQQAPALTEEQITGFKGYLEYIADYVKDFDEKKALANLAKNDYKKRWLCGKAVGDINAAGGEAFICSAKYPRTYFVLFDDNKKFVASDFSKKELEKRMKTGYSLETKSHPGCKAWSFLWEK